MADVLIHKFHDYRELEDGTIETRILVRELDINSRTFNNLTAGEWTRISQTKEEIIKKVDRVLLNSSKRRTEEKARIDDKFDLIDAKANWVKNRLEE